MRLHPGLLAGGCGAVVVAAALMRQPMTGLILLASCLLTLVLSRFLGWLPWAVFAAKLGALVAVAVLVPILFGGELIPVNPDQRLYLDHAARISAALVENPLAVDYAGIVGFHNRLYSIVLGWLTFLNGGPSVFLYRLLNLFLSLLLAGLAFGLASVLYPSTPKVARWVYLASAALPSVNVYTLFVLRDVLIASVLMLAVFGLFTRRYWLTLVSLALCYYTRIQLFFLLVGLVALFSGLNLARRFGKWSPPVRLALVVGFVVSGYFVAPLVLPPEYDYGHAWNFLGFGTFLLRFVPSFLGLDFFFVAPQARELEAGTLGFLRLLLVDTWLVPLLFLAAAWWYRRERHSWQRFYMWVLALALGYAAGYWIAYGSLQIRLLLPLYPVLLLVVPPLFLRTRQGVCSSGGQT